MVADNSGMKTIEQYLRDHERRRLVEIRVLVDTAASAKKELKRIRDRARRRMVRDESK